ncbi:MAG TPA: PRC-barrel domain-containing protein [Thermomicrobiales bacterium]|nr:PRC-barrel domain-containing protein [Thermomicrobiales bacterium]
MRLHGLLDQLSHEELRQAYTVMVLFDDSIDAENTLNSLRRRRQPAADISVIFREKVLDPDTSTPYRAVLSDVVAKSALDVVGSWLQGLSSLILPDRATYLAAGPIGAILATLRETRQHADEAGEDASPLRQLPTRQLTRTFQAFGFERDEATYVEQRVVAGSPLIAVTSDTVEHLRTAHEIFSQNQPVYIGLTRTDASIASQASRLLTTGPRGTGAVVIADTVSPLVHLTSEAALHQGPKDLRARIAKSQYGEAIGRVEDVLFEPEPESPPPDLLFGDISDTSLLIRYLVIRVGRGLGRQRIAIPSERIAISSDGVVVAVTHEELVSAPRYIADPQLSRQEEATIRRHFSAPFYWIPPENTEPAPGGR